MNRVKIGWSRKEISTEEPVIIPGQMYQRVSEGVFDPLYATALCIDGGEGQDAVIFCATDLLLVYESLMTKSIEKTVGKEPEIKPEWIVMNAIHTHAAVDPNVSIETSADGRRVYPGKQWAEFAAEQISDAIVEAYHSRKEGGIAYGYGYAVVGHSRRCTYLTDHSNNVFPGMTSNGYAVMYGRTDLHDFAGYEAGADHFENLLYTFDAEDRLTGMIVNVPCPSQVQEHHRKLTADYWSDVRALAAKTFGPEVYVLPQCAAAGDLAPRILHYKQAQARRMALKYDLPYDPEAIHKSVHDMLNKCKSERLDIAERIVSCAKEVYDWAKKDIQTTLRLVHRMEEVELPLSNISDEEYETAKKVVAEADYEKWEAYWTELEKTDRSDEKAMTNIRTRFNSFQWRNKSLIARYELRKEHPTQPMKMHIVAIGEIAFATNANELYMDFMHRIQARSPFIQTFVVQLAGDGYACYIPTSRSAANKGYGSSIYDNKFGPEAGRTIVEESLRILNEIGNGER